MKKARAKKKGVLDPEERRRLAREADAIARFFRKADVRGVDRCCANCARGTYDNYAVRCWHPSLEYVYRGKAYKAEMHTYATSVCNCWRPRKEAAE